MMRKILFFVICYLSTFSYYPVMAQEIEWQKTLGGTLDDYMSSGFFPADGDLIVQTSDAGYISGGTSMSNISGHKTEDSMGDYDFWVIKTDNLGNIQWQNTIGGSWSDYLTSISQTSDGGYICGGYSNSPLSGDKTEDSLGIWDIWVVKLDASGIVQWQQTIGGSNWEQLSTISQTADGGYICGGFSDSDISPDKSENSMGGTDYWVIKLDGSGVIQWENTIGGNDDDELAAVSQTTDGGYICGGRSRSGASGDKSEDGGVGYDYWIVKLDSSGSILWDNTITGFNGNDELNSIEQTADGGYICGGTSNSDSYAGWDKSENSNGSDDYWILKLDGLGNIEWQNTVGGSGMDILRHISQTSDGSYICGGLSVSGISGDKSEACIGFYDYWIFRLDSTGNMIWQNTIGGTSGDWFYSMSETADGGFICTGFSNSNVGGDKTENAIGASDYWIVKITTSYNLITGSAYIDANSNGIKDAGELPLQFKWITETPSGRSALLNSSGDYNLVVLDTASYTILPPVISYYTPVPATHNAAFSAFFQTDTQNDFAYQPSGTFNDLEVTLTPMGNFRSGFDASYMLNYINLGTTTMNSIVVMYPDPSLSFVSATPAPLIIAPDSIVWFNNLLAPYHVGNILVTMHVDSGLPIGTPLTTEGLVDPVSGDANPQNNSSSVTVFSTNSFDPNDIIVNRDSLFDSELVSPPYLEYTIRFQNTGNDTAIYVRITNNIPPELDLTTFEVMASSHTLNIISAPFSRLMEFNFDNIFLPDSGVNEPGSHGFVRYRIKPVNNLIVGNIIENQAAIYFDFNTAVITNMALTEIVMPVGISHQSSVIGNRLLVYPNPFRDEITIEISGMEGQEVAVGIFDIYGRLVNQIFNGKVSSSAPSPSQGNKLQVTSYLDGLSGGVYFVRMESGGGSQNFKIVKY